jgi:predicted CXXCH cytochrome family protein
MRRWKLTGFIATVIIVLTIPLYLLKVAVIRPKGDKVPVQPIAEFTGSKKCLDCHKKEYDKWLESHHDHAMDVANEKTVLGDFENTVFKIDNVESKFYRKDSRYFVFTQGPGGEMHEFEITHTFGWYPLQQYLVPFPGGRWQCLPIAWDVEKKKWYHLYPDAAPDFEDWLYWTNAGQNWNGMCAECHSTNLKKNYDPDSDTYRTTWSDIDVGCEACHGPGSRHVDWAELPDMARPQVENYELMVKTFQLGSRALVELCAPCHSRRAALGDYTHAEPDLLDSLLPSLLDEELYFSDGQVLEEVYVYGSFTQSKMYHRDVRCSDCHDVHSAKLLKEGNDLCLQCHRASEYDTKRHHFHKKKGEKGKPIRSAGGKVLFEVGTGADCVQCHMPGRKYMVIDYRPDHSIRIPRPDISMKLGTPNACNRCHIDQANKWSDDYITKWYGPGRRPHYANTIHDGRKNRPGGRKALIRLAEDPLYPVIVRATALSLLAAYPGADTTEAFQLALMDDEALIRRTAIQGFNVSEEKDFVRMIAPLLYDPVKAVRMEAAQRLAGPPSNLLPSDEREVFRAALREFKASMEHSADFAFGRFNLGNLYSALNLPEEAIRSYQEAIRIDELSYPSKVNLAMLYYERKENDKAEVLLREVVEAHPEVYEAAYSLGLLLGEMEQYDEAAVYVEKAAKGLPERDRIHYNLGLILDYLKRDAKAEAAFKKALELAPDNLDYLYVLANYYMKRGQVEKAEDLARQMVEKHPSSPLGHDFLRALQR